MSSDFNDLQFNYTANADSFIGVSDKVKKRLIEQEKELKKTEKSFLTFNKVLLASGVGLTVLAAKKIPAVTAGFKAFAKSTGSVFGSMEKIVLATQGVFGPFAKLGKAITGLTIGFGAMDLAMGAMGASTGSTVASFIKMGGLMSGALAVGLTGFIALAQKAADTIGNKLLARTREWLDIGAELQAQTFSLSQSLKQYRQATGDTSVTLESMTELMDDLARSTGQLRPELKLGLTTMLNLSRVTGLSADQIKVLIKRSADLALVFGTDLQEVVEAMDQSFKGYNQTLLNFGVNVNDDALAVTEFVKASNSTVDSLTSGQKAMAKYEAILKQTATSSNALSKSTDTIKGSALGLELAMESLQNRMAEGVTEVFGPFIVKMNQLKTSFIDASAQGGKAGLVGTITGITGAFFAGIAFILKWGTLLVILREGFKLLGFVIRNSSKIIGLFSGALNFMATSATAASVSMGNLAKTTTAFTGAAKAASAASTVFGVASSGLGKASNLAATAASASASKTSLLVKASKLLFKVLKVGGIIIGKFLFVLGKWAAIAAVVAVAVVSMGAAIAGMTKAILGFFGVDPAKAGDGLLKFFKNLEEKIKDIARALSEGPELIFNQSQLLVDKLLLSLINFLSLLNLIPDAFKSNFEQSAQVLESEITILEKKVQVILDRIRNKKVDDKDPKISPSTIFTRGSEFEDLLQEGTIRDLRRRFGEREALQAEQAILIGKQEELRKKEAALFDPTQGSGGLTLAAGVGGSSRNPTETILGGTPERRQEAIISLRKIRFEGRALFQQQERNAIVLTQIQKDEIRLNNERGQILRKELRAEKLLDSNRVASLKLQREALTDRLKLEAELAQGLEGDSRKEADFRIVQTQIEINKKVSEEKELRKSLFTEVGVLSSQFQKNRLKEIQQFANELTSIGVGSSEVVRLVGERIRNEQLQLWARVADRSSSVLDSLKGKLVLYFDATRNFAQSASEVLFSSVKSVESALGNTLLNIATGMRSMKEGFKDFRRAIVDIVLESLIQLGIEQAKQLLIQESGILKSVAGLQAEGTAVGVLTSQYAQLTNAKAAAGVAGRTGGVAGAVTPSTGFFANTGISRAPANGQQGPLLANGQFLSPQAAKAAGKGLSPFGAAGLGSIGGGLVGGQLGGQNAAQFGSIGGGIGAGLGFAFGGPIGAAAGGVIGGIAGGFIGGKRDKRKAEAEKIRKENLDRTQKFIDDAVRLLETGQTNLDQILSRVNLEVKINTGEIGENLKKFAENLKRRAEDVKLSFEKIKKDLSFRLNLLGNKTEVRGTLQNIESLRNEIESLRKEFEVLPSAAGNASQMLNDLFNKSLDDVVANFNTLIKDENKAFLEAARTDAGELISISQRAIIDIGKLQKDKNKFIKDSDKAIKDIRNEGVAVRQKTIAKDKKERIAELEKTRKESLLNFDNEISTIQIISAERTKANEKTIKELKEQIALVKEAREQGVNTSLSPVNGAGGGFTPLSLLDTPAPLTLIEKLKEILGPSLIFSGDLKKFLNDIDRESDRFGKELNRFGDSLGNAMDRLGASIERVGNSIEKEGKRIVKDIGSALGFAKGGPVPSTGLAQVHEGEYVIQEKYAKNIKPLLKSLNSGNIPVVSPQSGGNRGMDLSINIKIDTVDSSSRVLEIEDVVKRLQKTQLSRIRQMIPV